MKFLRGEIPLDKRIFSLVPLFEERFLESNTYPESIHLLQLREERAATHPRFHRVRRSLICSHIVTDKCSHLYTVLNVQLT